MSEKRELDTRKSMKIVTDNHFITADGLSKMSLKARKLLYLTAAQCRQNDDQFYEYTISVSDFASIMGIEKTHVYQEAYKITGELASASLTYLPDSGNRFQHIPVTASCEYTADGHIKIELNKRMTDFLLELRGSFTQPLLSDFMHMRSPYSMAVWHLMQREMHSRKPGTRRMEFYISLEELRKVTGCEQKLKQIGEFKKRVLDKALREIDECCGVKISYENRKQGRTVIGFDFVAVNALGIDLTDYDPPHELVDRARRFDLSQTAKHRELTPEEKAEYETLCANAEQMTLDI